eukprot:m.19343 g.19343  ORF g.19343 m.19343 type:complete len:209 (+) comp8448_c0_seq1:71-697(+)
MTSNGFFFSNTKDIDISSDSDSDDSDVEEKEEEPEIVEFGTDVSQKEFASSLKETVPDFLQPLVNQKKLEVKTFDAREPEIPKTPWLQKPGGSKDKDDNDDKQLKRAKRQQALSSTMSKAGVQAMAAAMSLNTIYKADKDAIIEEHKRSQKQQGQSSQEQQGGLDKRSFKIKEKRKRDIGQANGVKNWVEEEKRKLREASSSSGFGFD